MDILKTLRIEPITLRPVPTPEPRPEPTVEDCTTEACLDFAEDLTHHLTWLRKQQPGSDIRQAQALMTRLARYVMEAPLEVDAPMRR